MITQPAKLFLPLTALGVLAALVYSIFTGDHTGITLFFALATAGLMGGVSITVARDNEFVPAAPPEAADEPLAFFAPPAVRLPGGPGWPIVVGLGTGLILLGLIEGPFFSVIGTGLTIVGAVGWLASVSNDRTGRSPNLMPIGIPVVGLVAIFSMMFLMSRVLLAVPEQASTFVALGAASVIMAASSVIALRPKLSSRTVMTVLVIGSLVMIAGGLTAAKVGQRHVEEHAHAKEVDVTAKAVAFNLKQIDLLADQAAEINFDNADTVPHNVAIYDNGDYNGPAVFQGGVATAGQKLTYEIKPLKAGTYYFRCDIHPTVMKGTVTVA